MHPMAETTTIADRRAFVAAILAAVDMERYIRIHAADDPLIAAGEVVLDALLPEGGPVRITRQSGHAGREWVLIEREVEA